MRCLLPVAALITLAQPGANALSAQRSAPPRQVVSTWQIKRDGRGQELSRTLVNRRLEFGFWYIEGKPIDLLFVEEVRTTFKRSEEGDNGRVVVEAWASDRPDTAYRRRIWRLDMPGSRVPLRPDYYDVVQTSCCGSNDTHTYVSLATGQPVISFTDGPCTSRAATPDCPRPKALLSSRTSIRTQSWNRRPCTPSQRRSGNLTLLRVM